MRSHPRTASPRQTLATAGQLMAEIGAGVLPVLGPDEQLVGVLTDRDICLAVAMRDRRPSEIAVSEVMTERTVTCGQDEDLSMALETMRRYRVRRLPVVDRDRTLVGLLSLDDVVEAVGEAGGLGHAAIAETLKAINAHPLPEIRSSR